MATSDEIVSQISGRAAAAIHRLLIDQATAEILPAFAAHRLDVLLLKGRSFEVWLSRAGERLAYLDADLLIRAEDEEAASGVLASLGFQRRRDDSGLPDWWRDHGSEWLRASDGVLVDLHRSIPGVGVDEQTLWLTISDISDTVDVAGYPARTLNLPGRAVQVALHAAHHGVDGPKPLADLDRALELGDDQLWVAAVAVARRLDAMDAFAAGLRLRAAGEALADRLGLPVVRSVQVAMKAATAPPVALGFEQLAGAAGLRHRLEILAHKFFPPPGFMRHWWPPAARSRAWLAVAYLYRPLWLLRHAPLGLRAWLRAKRGVGRGRGRGR